MIINYSFETTYTTYPFYTVRTISLEGLAVKMEVGDQVLLEKAKYR
jgi:hypothetical protein